MEQNTPEKTWLEQYEETYERDLHAEEERFWWFWYQIHRPGPSSLSRGLMDKLDEAVPPDPSAGTG